MGNTSLLGSACAPRRPVASPSGEHPSPCPALAQGSGNERRFSASARRAAINGGATDVTQVTGNSSALAPRSASRKRTPAQTVDIAALPVQMMTQGSVGDQVRCTICLEDFVRGDSLKTMPCMHIYHSMCIDRWLWTDNSCPVCKTPIGSTAPSVQIHSGGDPPDDIAEELPIQPHRPRGECGCSGRLCSCNVSEFHQKCICHQGSPGKCKAFIHHRCVCDLGMSAVCRARHLEHECICQRGNPAMCKANNHPCLCSAGMTSRCRARAHECVCNLGTPSMCRSTLHPCVCRAGTTSHCRAEPGAHHCICGSGMACRCRADRHLHICHIISV